MILQFNYFLKNDFGLLLMLFWLFGLAMTSFSYFLSTLVKKTQVKCGGKGLTQAQPCHLHDCAMPASAGLELQSNQLRAPRDTS
jgi:hypothetical protein